MDAFINGQFQSAVAERRNQPGGDFRPGNIGNASLGLRYEANPKVVPQLQVNIYRKSHDQGALADTMNTAGTVVYLSPGITVNVGKGLQVYAFVQRAI